MKKYIPLDDLVAKIERTRNQEIQWMEKQGYTEYHQGLRDGYANILSFLDTLEVKEVDLEKELENLIEKKNRERERKWKRFKEFVIMSKELEELENKDDELV